MQSRFLIISYLSTRRVRAFGASSRARQGSARGRGRGPGRGEVELSDPKQPTLVFTKGRVAVSPLTQCSISQRKNDPPFSSYTPPCPLCTRVCTCVCDRVLSKYPPPPPHAPPPPPPSMLVIDIVISFIANIEKMSPIKPSLVLI